jgi:hypothetical protein
MGPRVELVSVRPVVRPVGSVDDEVTASANQPAEDLDTSKAHTGLTRLVDELETSVQADPRQLDHQLELRMLYLALGRVEQATRPFDGLDPLQTEVLATFCRVMASTREVILDPETPSPRASALAAAEDLRRLLGQQSPVIIQKMVLVTRVNSFGDYEAIMPPRFSGGGAVRAFVYTEVSNFRSEPTGDGRIRTLLSETVEIYDANGNRIWHRVEPEIEDQVLSARRDFFIPFPIVLPDTTPPGQYILKVTIEDKIGATTDQRRMTFTIAP